MFNEFFKELEKKPKILWALIFLYMSGIFYLSSLSYPPQPAGGIKHAPIIEHFIEFFILGTLLFLGFRSLKFHERAFLFSIILGIFYACTDEFHQLFVSGRCAELFDVFIDSLGVFSAVLLMRFKLK